MLLETKIPKFPPEQDNSYSLKGWRLSNQTRRISFKLPIIKDRLSLRKRNKKYLFFTNSELSYK